MHALNKLQSLQFKIKLSSINIMIDKSGLLEQSVLSIYHTSPKSELQQKYQQAFRQASQYRLLVRELKQENEWIKTGKQGLQNECRILKDLLGEKKQIILELNTDLRIANQEINRLEDMAEENKQIMERKQKEIGEKQKTIQSKNEYIVKLQYELENKRNTIDSLTKQRQNIKIDMQNKQKIHFFQVHDQVISILDLYQNNQKQFNQPTGYGTTKSKMSRKQENILKEVQNKIQNLVHKHNRAKAEYEQKLSIQRLELEKWKNKQEIVQLQLKQVTSMVEQYQQEKRKQMNKIKQLQSKIQMGEKFFKNKQKSMESICNRYQLHIIKLVQLFKPLLLREREKQMKIQSFFSNRQNNDMNIFELEMSMFIQEVKKALAKNISQREDKGAMMKQIKDLQNKNRILQEEYDILRLKFITLQRQFSSILDDNRRILKFNQVSRFRTDRNMKNYPSSQKNGQESSGRIGKGNLNSHNKENVDCMNTVRAQFLKR